MNTVVKTLAIFSLSAALVACGGGGSGGGKSSSNTTTSSGGSSKPEPTFTETVVISPSLGRITDATVKIYDASYNEVIGEGALNEAGKALVDVTYSKLEPMIVELTAGPNSTYFDEAAGEVVLPEGTQLHAITKDPRSTAVTPLTELAWQLALLKGEFPLDEERVDQLNGAVSQMIWGGARSITYAPNILSEMPAPNSQTHSIPSLHAAVLAAFAKVGDAQAAPALSVLNSLTSDMSEGILSNYNGGFVYSDFAAEFREELDSWVATYGDSEAQMAMFLMPMPDRTIDIFSNVPIRQRIGEMEYGPGIEIAYSSDDGGDWLLFPEGSEVSFHREGSVIGIAAGDNGKDPSAGEFIEGWSVDMATAEYENVLDLPDQHGVRVQIPTGDPNIYRYILFVTRDYIDFDDLILIEDDIRTSGSDRLAHVLSFDRLDFMESGVYDFFNDVHAMANNGGSLTVIISDEPSRVCDTALIGTNNESRYPKLVGLVHDDGSEIDTLQPQLLRYAEAGPQREITFSGRTLFRINDNTGRVDYVHTFGGDIVRQWATNDSDLIAEYCP